MSRKVKLEHKVSSHTGEKGWMVTLRHDPKYYFEDPVSNETYANPQEIDLWQQLQSVTKKYRHVVQRLEEAHRFFPVTRAIARSVERSRTIVWFNHLPWWRRFCISLFLPELNPLQERKQK